jgi:hypothetical protein
LAVETAVGPDQSCCTWSVLCVVVLSRRRG